MVVEPLMLHGLFYRCPHYVSGSGNRTLCSVTLLSMQGQKTLGFHQKYLNLCSEDEWKSCGIGTKWEWVIQWQNFNFWGNCSIPLRLLKGLKLEQKVLISKINIILSILISFSNTKHLNILKSTSLVQLLEKQSEDEVLFSWKKKRKWRVYS